MRRSSEHSHRTSWQDIELSRMLMILKRCLSWLYIYKTQNGEANIKAGFGNTVGHNKISSLGEIVWLITNPMSSNIYFFRS